MKKLSSKSQHLFNGVTVKIQAQGVEAKQFEK